MGSANFRDLGCLERHADGEMKHEALLSGLAVQVPCAVEAHRSDGQ